MQMILTLLVLLQFKHMMADFFLQTPRMLAARGQYLHWGRAQHAGLHGLLSALALLVVGVGPALALAISAAEVVVHFHIDWAKGRFSEARAPTPQDAQYWRAFGLDQFSHQLTYVAMIWAVAGVFAA